MEQNGRSEATLFKVCGQMLHLENGSTATPARSGRVVPTLGAARTNATQTTSVYTACVTMVKSILLLLSDQNYARFDLVWKAHISIAQWRGGGSSKFVLQYYSFKMKIKGYFSGVFKFITIL